MLRLNLAVALGRATGFFSRLLGRGGSALPGLVAEKVDGRLIEKLASTLTDGVTIVSGTNGKTTTTKMLVTALRSAGRRVLTNETGSNLARGVATVLLRASRRGRLSDHDLAVFEIDEAAARGLAPRLRPRLVIVTNLARDQLDRYGELDTTAAHLGSAVEVASRAVLNADDPAVAGLDAGRSAWFGAVAEIRAGMPHDRLLYGEDSPAAAAVEPDVLLVSAAASGDGQRIGLAVAGATHEVDLQVPGAYNGYNAAAAVAAAVELEIDAGDAAASLEEMPPAFGRGQVIEYSGRRVKLLLVKNPAGFNQAIRLLQDGRPGDTVLFAINDNHADGRDVSWLWDVRFEDLADTALQFGASGLRAADMALRLKYAGIDSWFEPNLEGALARMVASSLPGGDVYVVPTYTAMLELLESLLPGRARAEVWT